MAPRDHSRRAALAVLCTVLFVTFLDNTIVSVTLADIQGSLRAGVQTLQWVVNGYALAFASLMLAGGMLGDLFGRKRVMLGGLALFAGGSLVAAVAPSAGWLLAGRVIMGVGAAGSEPGTLSVIRHMYDDPGPRARALGVWAAVAGTALAMGPVVAGVLVGISDWRGVFWFNLALVGAALIATWIYVPESSTTPRPSMDVWGAVLGAVALASVTFAVIEGERAGYTAWWILGLFALSVVAAAAFVRVELHREEPMLNLRLLRNGRFAIANVVAFTTYFGVFSIFFFVALYLQLLTDRSPFATAADFLPMTVLMIGASALTGRWVARSGPKAPMTAGCILGGIGILAVDAVLGPHVGFGALWWSLGLAGIGFGIALVPVTSAALSAVPAEHSGVAAASANTSRELGAVFGVAILGALVNGKLTSNLIHRLNVLGIPANFQSIVIRAVTHGGVPKNAQQAGQVDPRAKNAGPIVDKVLNAAERAFYSGLHEALLVSACLLLASGVAAWFVFGWREAAEGAARGAEGGRARPPLSALARPLVLAVAVVGAAVGIEVTVGGGSVPSSATTSTTAPTSGGQGSGGGGGASGPTMSVDPASGLTDGQTVHVTGSGFPPGADLVVVECADRGDQTSAQDCAIADTTSVTAGPQGKVSTTKTVTTGPFGSADRVCDAQHRCQLSVSQPSASSGAARATAALAFAAH